MISWQTTLFGLLGAAATGIGAKYPEYSVITQLVTAIAMGGLGITAKDHNVTGGTKQQ